MQQLFPFALINHTVVLTSMLSMREIQQGVFTTLKVVGMHPFFLEKHLVRLATHAKEIGIAVTLGNVAEDIRELLLANNIVSSAVRISVLADGSILLDARELPQAGESVTGRTYGSQESLPRIKHIDRSVYGQAQKKVQEEGGDIALFVENHQFIETPISNIVSVDTAGQLITPFLSKQGLKGIIRQVLLEKGILVEKNMSVSFDRPIVLINSLRLQSLISLDGTVLPDPSVLFTRVKSLVEQEEKADEDSYYR